MSRHSVSTPRHTIPIEQQVAMQYRRIDMGRATTLEIKGVLDALSTVDLRAVIDALVAEQRRPVTIDLSALRLVDSSGVGAVVSLYKRARADGGEVWVVGLQGQPLAIFRLLRLDRLLGDPRR